MIENVIKEEYQFRGEANSSLFNKSIEVMYYDEADVTLAESCVRHFNSLPDQVIEKLCEYSIVYCNSVMFYSGEEIYEFDNNRDILAHIEPVCIDADCTEKTGIGYSVELNCSWETEHGMQWVIRGDDSIIYVGPYGLDDIWEDDEDGYDNFVCERNWEPWESLDTLDLPVTKGKPAFYRLQRTGNTIYFGSLLGSAFVVLVALQEFFSSMFSRGRSVNQEDVLIMAFFAIFFVSCFVYMKIMLGTKKKKTNLRYEKLSDAEKAEVNRELTTNSKTSSIVVS